MARFDVGLKITESSAISSQHRAGGGRSEISSGSLKLAGSRPTPVMLDNSHSLASCFCHGWPEWPTTCRVESVPECSGAWAEPTFERPSEMMGERP